MYGVTAESSAYVSGTSTSYVLNFSAISSPSKYLHLADSIFIITNSAFPNQIFSNDHWDCRIHLRHVGNTANGLFIDGHIGACQKSNLKDCGRSSAYLKNYTEITF